MRQLLEPAWQEDRRHRDARRQQNRVVPSLGNAIHYVGHIDLPSKNESEAIDVAQEPPVRMGQFRGPPPTVGVRSQIASTKGRISGHDRVRKSVRREEMLTTEYQE